MERRDFLKRTSIALAGGLILGDAALEAFERLTHRRTMFPSAGVGGRLIEWRGEMDAAGTLYWEQVSRPKVWNAEPPRIAIGTVRASHFWKPATHRIPGFNIKVATGIHTLEEMRHA